MVKYFIEFANISGDVYRGEFYNEEYTGSAIQLTGSAFMQSDLSDNIYQPLQIKSCDVRLKASKDNPLEDIYNEDDRYWLFTLEENNVKIFQGYVSTEGMEQPYNSLEWYLEFSVFGHLHYLENRGFYQDNGTAYEGRDSLLNIIKKCLDKGFNDNDQKFNIIASHHLTYQGNNIFQFTYLDQGQFYDEEGESVDCATILSDILKSLGAFIVQKDLFWVIMSVKNWAKLISNDIPYREYNATNTFWFDKTYTPNSILQRIGTQERGADIFHVNANQSFINKKLYNTVKVRHDFIYSEQVLPNGELESDNGTIPNWQLTSESNIVTEGIEVNGKQLVSQIQLAATSSSVSYKKDDVLEITISVEYFDNPTEQAFELILDNTLSGNTYTYRTFQNVSGSDVFLFNDWDLLPSPEIQDKGIEFKPDEGVFDHVINVKALPEDGDLTFKIYTGIFGGVYNASTSKTLIESIIIKAVEQPIEAEEFVAYRTDKKTGAIPDVVQIPFNTVDRNILKNILLDVNGVAIPSVTDGVSTMSLADFLSIDLLFFFGKNTKIFSGDVYRNRGFTPKRIDLVGSPFIVTNENKELSTGISTLTLQEVSLDSYPIQREVQRVYREPIKPVIK